jgi:non-ribosomal peptide synthetase component F
VLKAGGAYVPLDPQYPAERLTFTIADAQLAVLLTQGALAEQLPAHEARVVHLESDCQTIAGESELSPEWSSERALSGANLAYVIYTSGSTGVPKGVAIAHQSTTTLIHWAQATFAPSALRGVLAFDFAVLRPFSVRSVRSAQ